MYDMVNGVVLVLVYFSVNHLILQNVLIFYMFDFTFFNLIAYHHGKKNMLSTAGDAITAGS